MADGGGNQDFDETLSITTSISHSSENLEFDLEELDDVEYDIPPVDNPPTLESILNEPDETSDDELPTNLGVFIEVGDTVSVASTNSIDSKGRRHDKRHRKSTLHYESCGPILRHAILRGISSQISSAADRISAGMPSAMAASLYLAVGTFHGLVLVFDGQQVLKWCLGNVNVGSQYGSVSAVSFNNDCTRLLCGFAKGAITMWDLVNGKLLRTILDAHPPGSAVLHIKFTDDPTLAVCSDSGGSVFELNFRRVMGVRSCESRCLFSGSRGEVCAIQTLQFSNAKDHPLQEFCILAMATLSKVIVISIRPRLKVLFSHALLGDPSTLPLLAWQFVIIQVSPITRIVDPVFSFGRGNVLHFVRVTLLGKDKIVFVPLTNISLNYTLLNFTWLNPRTIVTIDLAEHLHVIDVRTQEDLEVVDLAEVQLIYGSSHFKGLSTGGNVSKAMVCAGNHACYQSVIGYQGQLLLLGTKSVHLVTIRSWKERLDYLVKQHKYQEALALAQSFLENKGKAVVGLVGKKEDRMITIAKAMWRILESFLENSVVFGFDASNTEAARNYLQEMIPICIEYHLLLENSFSELERQGIILPSVLPNFIEHLFSKVYDMFRNQAMAKSIFLQALEVHIMNNEFASIPIPPSVLHEFVEHYANNGMYDALELCIVHLNVESIDLHQVLTLCWDHSLYDAILYIHNKAMRDYTGPLEELLSKLEEALQKGKQLTDLQIILGNKILVYISCCLAGRAYPIGNIPPQEVSSIKKQVFTCLITRHSVSRKPKEPLYPHLRTLLHFDTREFLNVLALAFEEQEFDDNQSIWKRQDVVDILIDVMHNNTREFSPTQVGSLFTFLARQMAKHEKTLIVNRSLFEQVIEYVTNTSDESRHEERQQALLELHAAGGLKYYDEEHLLLQAEKAHFFRVCELLYLKRREYDRILPCYLQDPARKLQLFSFVKQVMTDKLIRAAEKENLKLEVLKNIEEFLDIDNLKTCRMILECFPEELNNIMESLHKNSELQYKYLQGIFEIRGSLGFNTSGNSSDIQIDSHVVEKYIDLMCYYSPKTVYSFVSNLDECRLEKTLVIVQRHKISDAAAFLLERLGQIQEAFTIMLKTMDQQISDLLSCQTDEKGINNNQTLALTGLDATLLVMIQFCQRNSLKMLEAERETLWFQLLETLLIPLRNLTPESSSAFHKIFKDSTTHLLNSMMGYIKLPAILEKILKDPSYKMSKFSEIRDLILGMLDTYNYEKTLLQTTKNLLHNDLHHQLSQLCLAANRSYAVHMNGCSVCGQDYKYNMEKADVENIIIFRCGHSYHFSCYQTVTSNIQTTTSDDQPCTCHLCERHKQKPILHRRISVKQSPDTCDLAASTSNGQRSTKSKNVLGAEQIQNLERLRQISQTGSRFAMLKHLGKKDSHLRKVSSNQRKSIFQRDDFKLRLAPPRQHSSS